MIICIGPICVPVWHLGLIALMLFRPLLELFRRLCGGRNAQAGVPGTTETPPATMGHREPSWKENEPHQRRRKEGVTVVKSEDDLETLKRAAQAAGVPLFVDFGATWCSPCRRMAPVFERLSRSYSGMFASVDVDECPNLPDLPPALPTFKVYKAGLDAVDTLTGANQEKLEAMVARHATCLT